MAATAYRSGHCNPDVAAHGQCGRVYGTSERPATCSCPCHTQPVMVDVPPWGPIPQPLATEISRHQAAFIEAWSAKVDAYLTGHNA